VAFATSKTVPALARNPLSDRFILPLKESGFGNKKRKMNILSIPMREIHIILFM
jgi:hypothetical protein